MMIGQIRTLKVSSSMLSNHINLLLKSRVLLELWLVGKRRRLVTFLEDPASHFDSNAFIRINLLIIFITMGVVAHSAPNFDAAAKSLGSVKGPVVTEAFGNLPLFLKVKLSPKRTPVHN